MAFQVFSFSHARTSSWLPVMARRKVRGLIRANTTRIPLETLHRNAILVGARILRIAAGGAQQEAFDSIAAQVDPTDLPRLRAAMRAHLSASSTAIREAAQYALRW